MQEEPIADDRDEMEDVPETRATVVFVVAALVAAGAGVLVGLLVAPTSGREIRRTVRRRVNEEAAVIGRKVRRAVEDVGRNARHRVEDTLDQGKQTLSRLARLMAEQERVPHAGSSGSR